MHNIIFVRAKKPEEIRLNEGIFGSYKNKRTENDKLAAKKNNVERVYRNVEKGFAEKIYKEIVEEVYKESKQYVINVLFDNLHLISNLDAQQIPLNIEYNKNGNKLNVLVRLLVFAYNGSTEHLDNDIYDMASLNLGFLHDMVMINYYTKIIKKLKERSKKSNSTIGNELKDWFDVKTITWEYKYHLVDPNTPTKLFNKNIFFGNVILPNKYDNIFFNLKEFIDTCFDWFNIESYTFTISNINNVMDLRSNNCILGEYGKYIKTSHLKIKMIINNDIKSLGDNYENVLFTNEPSRRTITLEQDIPSYYGEREIRQTKRLSPNTTIFTDELLMEIIGLTNDEIINDIFHLDKSYVLSKIKVDLNAKKTKKILSYDFARKPMFMKNVNLD